MAFDGIVISNLTYELNTNLVGGRISKISMPEDNELIFTIKNNAKTYPSSVEVLWNFRRFKFWVNHLILCNSFKPFILKAFLT